MQKQKKNWTTPRLKRLEPTPELLELFTDQLAERGLAAAVQPKRAGASSR